MIGFSYLSEFASYMRSAGLNVRESKKDALFTGVGIDSRTIVKQQLFVAIVGERLDGHDFLEKAIKKGASCFIVQSMHPILEGQACLVVNDSFKALGLVGKFNREKFSHKVIGLTGSSGKTSTKEMLAALFTPEMQTIATQGNLNNYYGVPLMLARISDQHKIAVIEMGTSAPGEIAYLSQLVNPSIGLITNASAAHLSGLGTLEGVVSEKGDIIKGIVLNGLMVLNGDDPFFTQWSRRIKKERPDLQIVSFGSNHTNDVSFSEVMYTEHGMTFTLHTSVGVFEGRIPVWGKHQVANACAAITIALFLGMSINNVLNNLSLIKAVAGRGKRTQLSNGALIIDESYNANISSTRSAIDMLDACGACYKIMVLADMKELGEYEIDAHKEMGNYLRSTTVNELFTYGDLAKHVQDGWGRKGRHFGDKSELCSILQNQLNENVAVLIKGSFSMGMKAVVDACLKQAERSQS